AEDRRQQHVAHRRRQLNAALLRAVEMHRQIEPVTVRDSGLGEALPAFYMTARRRGQREIDKHPDFERAAPGMRRGNRNGVLNAQLLDDGQTLSLRLPAGAPHVIGKARAEPLPPVEPPRGDWPSSLLYSTIVLC